MLGTKSPNQDILLQEERNGLPTRLVEQGDQEDQFAEPEIIPESEYISGWKLHLNTFALLLALFAAQMEQSIVSTSVLAITNELKGFDKSGWIFTAFLLTYTGLMMIWAKVSDIMGRKPLILAAVFIFIVFSAACGASKTLTQLIVFRCLQGIGGGGIFSLTVLIFFEMVPVRKFPTYGALIMLILMCSVTFGPLLGGAINNNTTWRWIFWLNIPICTISLVILVFLLPERFPGQHKTVTTQGADHSRIRGLLRTVDFIGATLLLGTCVLLITGMQQAAEGRSFSSRLVLPMLISSGVMLIAFFLWQRYIAERNLPEPVFPWQLLTNRVYMGMILNSFFTGTILIVLTFQIPQRFQTVNGDSALKAGVRLIAFGLIAPFGSTVSAIIVGKTRIPPIYILILGGFLEIVGTVGLSKSPSGYEIWPTQYAFQVIAGLGVGCFNAILMLMVPVVVKKQELAIGTAAITQFRVLGGTIGLAIVISAMNRTIRPDLLQVLSPEQVNSVLDTTSIIKSFPSEVQTIVRTIFGRGYNLQMEIMVGFAVAQLPSTLLMWTRTPIMIPSSKSDN
ncbi:Efflux pump FUS6 [Lachnellula suecica]|uniref:Efflux pump FUS6 n=1 Tax=Lachnellula suecica TaxID=602035 RepID=A0A8T9C9G3_9HELO|nr:Efflux pump FUS6 [Lachnellula suecica]